MDTDRTRRRYLGLLGASAAVALAGCGGGGSEGSDDDSAPDDGTGDGDGDGNQNGGDDGQTDDGQDGDGDDGQNGDGQDGDGDDGQNGDGDDQDGGDRDDDQTDSPRLEDVFTWNDSYVMEFDGAEFSGTWRFNDGDWQLTTTEGGESFQTISIETDAGRDTYVVAEGECFKTTVPDLQDDLFDPEEPAGEDLEYVARGRTTVDGVDVYEFDINDGVYYISVDTGYPVRFESADDGSVVRFHSWGATDPISPPDVECIEP